MFPIIRYFKLRVFNRGDQIRCKIKKENNCNWRLSDIYTGLTTADVEMRSNAALQRARFPLPDPPLPLLSRVHKCRRNKSSFFFNACIILYSLIKNRGRKDYSSQQPRPCVCARAERRVSSSTSASRNNESDYAKHFDTVDAFHRDKFSVDKLCSRDP